MIEKQERPHLTSAILDRKVSLVPIGELVPIQRIPENRCIRIAANGGCASVQSACPQRFQLTAEKNAVKTRLGSVFVQHWHARSKALDLEAL